MIEQNYGTIAALEFAQSPKHGFEDIVEEVDISFQPVGLNRRSLIRDSEDIAIIERDNLRVVLGWVAPADLTAPHYLVLAVGPTDMSGQIHITPETCGFVKDVLVDHLGSYLSFATAFHAEATQIVGADLVDTVTEILHRDYDDVPLIEVDWPATANIPFDAALHAGHDLGRAQPCDGIRESSQLVQLEQQCSLPKRLTIYTLGATMLLYTPPVGASLLVYSTLRDLMPQPALQH